MSLLPACRPVLLLGCMLFITGCGASTPPLAPVTGTVSYRGQPLPTGMVVFTPDTDKGSSGPISHAPIQPDGSFSLFTGDSPGAVAGWHRITVVAVSDADGDPSGQQYPVPVSLIPERYRSADQSGLTREVRLGEKNVIHLNLD